MRNSNVYALLTGVGDYTDMAYKNLPTYKMDLSLIGKALENGLKIPRDNIRLMAGNQNNGFVSVENFARALNEFNNMSKDDIFILYFSGHGSNQQIVFSDGMIGINSILAFCRKMSCGSAIVIFDCCYSGSADNYENIEYDVEKDISDYIGKGIEILSSTSANDISRLGPNGTHSLFTGALSSSIMLPGNIKKGKISLNDIYNSTIELINAWSRTHKGQEQKPVIRSNMTGTLLFSVADVNEYRSEDISWRTSEYEVCSVEPLSSLAEKRLCVFAITYEEFDIEKISEITIEITEKIKCADVYSNEKSEKRFKGKSATAIWCYFGLDYEDIVNHVYFANTIWAEQSAKEKYYRNNKCSSIINGIWVCENPSYKMLKEMNRPTVSRNEFILQNKTLLFAEMSFMNELMRDLQETRNDSLELLNFIDNNILKAKKVKRLYIKITDLDVPPVDLREWSDAILVIAGYVLDVALIMERCMENKRISERDLWLIQSAINNYNLSLLEIKNIEKHTKI